VDEEEIGLIDLLSLPNLALSAPLRTKSELLQEEDKHDFFRPEAIKKSIAVSIM
jgi:hypothetical protein